MKTKTAAELKSTLYRDSRDALALAAHDDEKVHAVNANGGVVLDTQIDVLLNTETKVASIGKVLAVELKLLDLLSFGKERERETVSKSEGGVVVVVVEGRKRKRKCTWLCVVDGVQNSCV